MDNETLLTALKRSVREGMELVEKEFIPLPDAALNWKPGPEKWSILECLDHLNRYNRYYNTQIKKALAGSSRPFRFSHGWLGGYFIRTVSPDNGKPMQTLKHLNPAGSHLDQATLQEFLAHQKELLRLLEQARGADLNRRRVPVEVFRLLRIKTGDALTFVIRHQERHLQQALRVKRMNHFPLSSSERTRING